MGQLADHQVRDVGEGGGCYQVSAFISRESYNTVHLPWMCPLCAVGQRTWEILPLTGELLTETEESGVHHGTS